MFFKEPLVKAMFTVIVFKILLFKEGRYYHPPSGKQRVKELKL